MIMAVTANKGAVHFQHFFDEEWAPGGFGGAGQQSDSQ
jgi:hypothetical protein